MRQALISTIVSGIVAILALAFYLHRLSEAQMHATAAAKETAYERVMRTGTIRCGYTSRNPLFFVDPAHNEKTGVFHDMMEEIGQRLGLKIFWQEEISAASIVEAIKAGRVDMACAGYWLSPGYVKNVSSSVPQLYSPLHVWVRQDEDRHFENPDDLNSDQLTVATIDGSAESRVVAKRFQKTKVVSLPELSTNADEIESLIAKKADFIVVDANSMASYIANNPDKVKNLFPNQPLNVVPNVMLLPPDNPQFKEMIDNTLLNAEYDGTLDAILKKYHMDQAFLRNPVPAMLYR